MAYKSISELWSEEREQVRLRELKYARRAVKLKEVNELPTLSQRIVGRLLLIFGK